MKIILVEDNISMRELIAETLRMEDHDVICYENGKQAIEALRADSPHFDIIITDLLMPYMDGITFIKTLRNSPEWARVPCVVLSGDLSDKHRALASGADAFLIKPFHYNDLYSVLNGLVG